MLFEKSEILSVNVEAIPQALKDVSQWVLWRAEPSEKKSGALDKVPYRVNQPGVHASSTNAATWADYERAHEIYSTIQPPVDGLMFACGNGIGAIDIDGCINLETGEIDKSALEIIAAVDSYTEKSVSGRGIRIFARLPEAKGCRGHNVEIYTTKRFMTVTGQHVPGTPLDVFDRSEAVEGLRATIKAQQKSRGKKSGNGKLNGQQSASARRKAKTQAITGNQASSASNQANATALGLTDAEILARCQYFTGFTQLWNGDHQRYPSASDADMALAGFLAFACGPNEHARVERLMRQSGLVREKWDRADYLTELTIPKAFENRTDFYNWETDGQAGLQENNVDPNRPVVLITNETDRVLCEIEYYLGGELYVRNNSIVRLERAPELTTSGGSIKRAPGAIMLGEVTGEQVERLMSRHLVFKKPVVIEASSPDEKQKIAHQKVKAPAYLARLLVRSNEWVNMPNLIGITNSPFISPRGEVIQTPGYDPSSGYLLVDDGTCWDPVPQYPSPRQVEESIRLLHDLICDFPFENEFHRSAWVAALLTVVGRPAIPGPVPMYLVDGNKASTGKTKLSRLIGLICLGNDPTEISFTSDEKELENRIAAILIAGDRLACFDNIANSVRNSTLDRFLTSTFFGTRAFFKQKMLRLQNTTTLTMTGNNLVLRGDLFRRVIRSRLVTDLERPQYRTGFRHAQIEDYVRQNRSALLAAALTVLRAHAAQGFPADPSVHPLGSFTDWDRVVRHAMLQAGLPDPVATQVEVVEEDEDHIKLEHLLQAWHNFDPNLQGTTTHIIGVAMAEHPYTRCEKRKGLLEALRELTGSPIDRPPCQKKLAYRLRDAKEKRIGGLRVVQDGSKGRCGFRWGIRED